MLQVRGFGNCFDNVVGDRVVQSAGIGVVAGRRWRECPVFLFRVFIECPLVLKEGLSREMPVGVERTVVQGTAR